MLIVFFLFELTSSLDVSAKACENERSVAVADSVDTNVVEGGDFMFKRESSIVVGVRAAA